MIQYKKNISSFLFYDYETFGINPALDKPAQFACIRTDINFNIIEDPQCFYCFPSDDYIPDPSSILITHITPQYTEKYGTNEYLFTKKIFNILKKSNTCIIGYNNIHFDDEVTRNLFYRNFFDPYEWSWKNGNSRWDLLHVLRACYALRPNGINWPRNKLGLTSFKLSKLTKVNNIQHLNAHNAMSDVYATIEMAKLVKQQQKKLFDFFFQHRIKNTLYKFINVKQLTPLVYVSSFFGASRYNVSLILPILWHQNNKNILISVDLFKDVKNLIILCNNVFFEKDFIKNLFHLGITFIYLNRCPILAPINVIRKKDYNRLNFDINLYQNNVNLIKKNMSIFEKIKIIFSKENSISDSSNVDLQIYNSFFDIHDKKIIKLISDCKPVLVNIKEYNFHDIRLQTLLFRYCARNFFRFLKKDEKKIWLKYCLNILSIDVLKEYKNKIKNLLKEHSSDVKKVILLNDTWNYITQKRDKLLRISRHLN